MTVTGVLIREKHEGGVRKGDGTRQVEERKRGKEREGEGEGLEDTLLWDLKMEKEAVSPAVQVPKAGKDRKTESLGSFQEEQPCR